MKFDVLELYELYQDKPQTFAPILRNVNGSEIRRLTTECHRFCNLVAHCNTEGHTPWEDVYAEAEQLVANFEEAISFFQCFRKIDMGGYLTADEIIARLEDVTSTLRSSCQDFQNGMNVLKNKIGRSAASENDVEAEFRELATPLQDSIAEAANTLQEIDCAI